MLEDLLTRKLRDFSTAISYQKPELAEIFVKFQEPYVAEGYIPAPESDFYQAEASGSEKNALEELIAAHQQYHSNTK